VSPAATAGGGRACHHNQRRHVHSILIHEQLSVLNFLKHLKKIEKKYLHVANSMHYNRAKNHCKIRCILGSVKKTNSTNFVANVYCSSISMLFVDHRGHAARGNGGRPAASGCGGR
jgi:hypothetical protein